MKPHSEMIEAVRAICDEECEKVFDQLFDTISQRVAAEVPGLKFFKSRDKFEAGYAHIAWHGPRPHGVRVDPRTQQAMISLPLGLCEVKIKAEKPVPA